MRTRMCSLKVSLLLSKICMHRCEHSSSALNMKFLGLRFTRECDYARTAERHPVFVA